MHPHLTPAEKDLRASGPMCRLGGLGQLSHCSQYDFKERRGEYPAAQYSRLAHSVMCLGWMQRWLELQHVWRNGREATDYEAEVLRSAALLHDIGHPPYGHVMEPELPYDHETRTREIILKGEISDTLRKGGMEPTDVVDAVGGNGAFGQLVNGQLDVDKIAYVYYDSMLSCLEFPFTRGNQPTDWGEEMLKSMGLLDGELVLYASDESRDDPCAHDGLIGARHLLDSRTKLYIYLYGYEVNSKVATVMRNAVQVAKEGGGLEGKELFKMNDSNLAFLLEDLPKTQPYMEKIKCNLPTTAVATSIGSKQTAELKRITGDRNKRLEFEERTGSILDLNPIARAPKGTFPVLFDGTKMTLSEASDLYPTGGISPIQREHETILTRRLVAYTYGKPEQVGRKVCSELGIEGPEELVNLPGFASDW